MRAVVDALAALLLDQPEAAEGLQQLQHVRGAVDDRRVHHRALAAGARAEDAGEDAHRQVQRAAADVADQGDRRGRRLPRRAAVVQRAGQGDVVVVVAGGVGQRTVLAPAGHPAVDQLRVAREADVRAEA
ncbi:hypothetical protein D3C76_1239050 [compost metagenome]